MNELLYWVNISIIERKNYVKEMEKKCSVNPNLNGLKGIKGILRNILYKFL